uniref:Uncharacterized protein n=1 Tax=Eutreptiella gymnastica TaxID=73025 RepID=A0A7S1IVP1_9EUGL|mmetsp:Transcript_45636/g.81613  ORF Transcript_45636/g.81613 Transcript_45636/m.81613 type:complete len:135 (+) Transcript_45636:215-619(+)
MLSTFFGAHVMAFRQGTGWGCICRPICNQKEFKQAWDKLAPTLGPVVYHIGPPLYVALHWLLHQWAAYIKSRPVILQALVDSQPLSFIVQGDRYPIAGTSLIVITISLTYFALHTCTTNMHLPTLSHYHAMVMF